MTRILRFLLIAAVLLPLSNYTAAQDALTITKVDGNEAKELIPQLRTTEGEPIKHNQKLDRQHRGKHAYAPSTKANSNQIYDYFSKYILDSGITTNSNLPINTSYLTEARDEGQMIYRTSALGIESDVEIVEITFFASSTIPDLGTNNVTLRIGETTTNYHPNNNYSNITNLRASTTEVYTGPLQINGSTLVITFSEPYAYHGDNLIVDLAVNSGTTTQNVSWYGVQTSNNNYDNGSGLYARPNYNYRTNFLPTMYIKYRKPHEGTVTARDITVKNTAFFANKEYTWTDNEGNHTSTLDEVATTPEQMIAMISKIYTDQTIPGNKKRGFAVDGSDTGETNQAVYYSGVGGIKYTATGNNSVSKIDNVNNYEYDDIYGWGISGNPVSIQTHQIRESTYYTWNAHYTYMDLAQYEPNEEGLTLLLVEMKEDYEDGSNNAIRNSTSYTNEYDRLKAFFQNTVKSVRVISEAKRTGEGFDAGTLFKIDCDHMNKFFLLAKGQLHLDHNSENVSAFSGSDYDNTFCVPPLYSFMIRTGNLTGNNQYTNNGFLDYNTSELFYHMFEQFSPTMYSASSGADDLYQDMINMESFPVIHDCLGITRMNHQFLMYGADSKDEDCQDVRDMMFFIPDYRMLYHGSRGSSTQEYLNYHPDLQPTVGMYVIRQDEITPTAEEDEYYMLQLNWRTNLDDFLPSEQQEFYLLQVVVDETTGQETYVPVYYRDAQGNYIDENGDPSDEPVAIVLHLGPGAEKSYPDVYVKRLTHGQQVTYAIQGRDYDPVTKESFLSLQISNRQSYIVPGTDPTELVLSSNATYYSRYNPQTEKNCYSNKIAVGNYIGGLTNNLIQGGTTDPTIFKFYRMLSENDANPVLIGTAQVTQKTASGGKLQITMSDVEGVQSPATEFPYGKDTGLDKPAGYHNNKSEVNFTFYKDATGAYITDDGTSNGNKYVNFGNDFIVYDNFVEDLHKTDLPNRYYYKIEFNTAENIKDKDGNSVGKTAHGNVFNIPVYRTASAINGSFTFDQIKGDDGGNLSLPEAINFDVNIEKGSKTELYRYDAYRWMNTPANQRFILSEVDGDDEQDIAPTGTAGNQDSYFTVKMNNEYVNASGSDYEYYESHDVTVAETGYTKATFIDNIPIKKADNPAAVYDYAPVIERYASGFDASRSDYNTYGGIIQSVAIGKLELSDATDAKFMSIYNWESGGKKYAYYTFKASLDTKDVPTGYALYKVRAWRVLDPSIEQKEEYEELNGRMGTKVLFEDVTYDPATPAILDALDIVGAAEKSLPVEEHLIQDAIPYYSGTFGAQKLRTSADETGVIEEIKGKIIVRMYFTKNENLPTSTQGAPRLLEETTGDGKYYIVEKEIEFSQVGGSSTITGIDMLDAREVAGVKYYNVAGIESDTPFQGVNIVVTRYTDGSVVTKKIIK